ncbi:hypothetical protein KSS87_016516, partial [Heliosperma pusillum]
VNQSWKLNPIKTKNRTLEPFIQHYLVGNKIQKKDSLDSVKTFKGAIFVCKCRIFKYSGNYIV